MKRLQFVYGGLMIMIALYVFSCNKISLPNEKNNGDSTIVTSPKDSIVYNNINPDSIASGTFGLDLNNDGIGDFMFIISVGENSCGDNWMGYYHNWGGEISLSPVAINNAIIVDSSGHALALDSAVLISPDSLWSNKSRCLMAEIVKGRCSVGSVASGYWSYATDKYLGLKFAKDGDDFYGWVKISSSVNFAGSNAQPPSVKLVIKDYAYNATPNRPILAGQIK